MSNEEIGSNSAAVSARGVRSEARLHPASPLYPERFGRVPGIDPALSAALYEELVPWVGDDGLLEAGSAEILADIEATPGAFPTLATLGGAEQGEVLDQVRATLAEHQMFSDWASYALAFLGVP